MDSSDFTGAQGLFTSTRCLFNLFRLCKASWVSVHRDVYYVCGDMIKILRKCQVSNRSSAEIRLERSSSCRSTRVPVPPIRAESVLMALTKG